MQEDQDGVSQQRHYDIKGKGKAAAVSNDADTDTDGSTSNPYLALTPEEEERLRICRPPVSSEQTIGPAWEWGLPLDPGGSKSQDEALKTKLAHYHNLKSSTPPIHFNTSLFSNRSFRNPHIYDKLVAYIGIDERASMEEDRSDGEWERARPDRLAAAQEEYVRMRDQVRDSERKKGKGKIEFTSAKRRERDDEEMHRKRDRDRDRNKRRQKG